jgi:hypothetical protein
MVAVTYGVARVLETKSEVGAQAKAAQNATPVKPWYVRMMDALIESRMQQARREVALHARLLQPRYSFDEYGNRLVQTGSKDMPFGGW